MPTDSRLRPAALLIVASFVAVYLIWGSTYLAIRFAIETMPPFLMASARWLIAGALLYAWRRAAGDAPPVGIHWRTAFIVGGLLIVGGNGLVSWAQQWVPSSLTALLIAVVPAWVALLEWLGPRRVRPAPRVLGGIALGLAGVAALVGPHALSALDGAGFATLVGTLVILLASFFWANGSLYSRAAPRPSSPLLGASMQMLAGGLLLALAGLARGEVADVDLATISGRSWLSFAFLVFLGSIVAYSAYVWLLQVVRAELVATYAFVNPVVAVILGVVVANEAFTMRTALVAAAIVVAIAVIVTAPRGSASMPAPAGHAKQ